MITYVVDSTVAVIDAAHTLQDENGFFLHCARIVMDRVVIWKMDARFG